MSEIWNLSTLCRCCHADGCFKRLNQVYPNESAMEIYEVMLQESLGLKLIQPVTAQASYTICDTCINQLRDASQFRAQVVECEEKYKVYLINEQFVDTNVAIETVKSELDTDSDDDDYKNDINVDENVQDMVEVEIKGLIAPKVENENDTETQIEKEEETETKCEKEGSTEDQSEKKDVTETNITPIKETNSNAVQKKSHIDVARNLIKKDVNFTKFIKCITNGSKATTYSCTKCQCTYYKRQKIEAHVKSKHFFRCKCVYCGKGFHRYSHLDKHVKTQHGKVYPCQFCDIKFSCRISWTRHQKYHSATKDYLCDHCGRKFLQKFNLVDHIRVVHLKLKPYTCSICGKAFPTKRRAKNHMKLHSEVQVHEGEQNKVGQQTYKCDYCSKKFATKKRFKQHRQRHENQFECLYCHVILPSKDEFILHKNAHFRGHLVGHLTCHICGQILMTKYSLNRHMVIHSGDKKFACDICGTKFTQKSLVLRHILRNHNRNKQIETGKCVVCKRFYKDIDKHMESHEDYKRTCSCDVCGKRYLAKSSLRRHKLSHNGIIYDCDVCGKGYKKIGSLKSHKMKIHDVDENAIYIPKGRVRP